MFLKLSWNNWAFKLLYLDYYRLSKQENNEKHYYSLQSTHAYEHIPTQSQSLNVSYLTSNSTSILSWENTISE